MAILLEVQKTIIPRDTQIVETMSWRFWGRKKIIQMGIELESTPATLCKRSVRIGLWGGWKKGELKEMTCLGAAFGVRKKPDEREKPMDLQG